jgi:protein SCO1/2
VPSTEPRLARTLWRVAVSAFTIALACGPRLAAAQDLGPAPTDRVGAGAPTAGAMPELLQDVGLDQNLNAQLPLHLQFKDEQGRTVTLGDYFGKRPVILTLAYYECPMLCTQVLNGVASAIGVLKFSVGHEYEIVTVSFDPRDTPERARAKKANYIERYNRPGAEAGWHFLTGNSREISALTRAVGFRYAYNASIGQFAHASGIMVATPDGRLSHYLYGIEYWPRDLRLALIEAADRKIGSPVDDVLLYCFHYDPASGKYSLAVMTVVRIAGVLTLVAGATAIVLMRRRERNESLARKAHALGAP